MYAPSLSEHGHNETTNFRKRDKKGGKDQMFLSRRSTKHKAQLIQMKETRTPAII